MSKEKDKNASKIAAYAKTIQLDFVKYKYSPLYGHGSSDGFGLLVTPPKPKDPNEGQLLFLQQPPPNLLQRPVSEYRPVWAGDKVSYWMTGISGATYSAHVDYEVTKFIKTDRTVVNQMRQLLAQGATTITYLICMCVSPYVPQWGQMAREACELAMQIYQSATQIAWLEAHTAQLKTHLDQQALYKKIWKDEAIKRELLYRKNPKQHSPRLAEALVAEAQAEAQVTEASKKMKEYSEQLMVLKAMNKTYKEQYAQRVKIF